MRPTRRIPKHANPIFVQVIMIVENQKVVYPVPARKMTCVLPIRVAIVNIRRAMV